MHGRQHPSPKTLRNNLRDGLAALEAGRLIVVDPGRHVAADLEELGVDEATYWALIPRLLKAAIKAGPEACYAGGRPPARSTKHREIKNLEMWAFKVTISKFSFPVYFKFSLKNHPKTGELFYCHVDCHPDK